MRSSTFIRGIASSLLCSACSSGGSGAFPVDAGSSGGAGGVFVTGGSSGTGAKPSGGFGGVGGSPAGGVSGVGGGGTGGSVAGSGGSSGESGYIPSTPGCSMWEGNCAPGASDCGTPLYDSPNCGACNVSCSAGEACVGSVCAFNVDPNQHQPDTFFRGKTGVIAEMTAGGDRSIAFIPVSSGTITQPSILVGDSAAYCMYPKTAAESDDGAIYLSCTLNDIWRIPAGGGAPAKILSSGTPNSNNLPNIVALGSKLFYTANGGIFRSNLDGTGNELWLKNACVSALAADAGSNEIAFLCKYDHTIRVRQASKPPSLDYSYDREIAGTGNGNELWIDSTHYWYRRLDQLSGNSYTGALLRVPKQGGAEESMLDTFSPPALEIHVGEGGAYAVQLVNENDERMRILRIAKDGQPEKVLVDWLHGYQVREGSLFVGKSTLVLSSFFDRIIRLPL